MSDLDRTTNKRKVLVATVAVVLLALGALYYFLIYQKDPTGQPVDQPDSSQGNQASLPPEPPELDPEPEMAPPEVGSEQQANGLPATPPVTTTPQPVLVTIDQPGIFSTPGTYRQIVINCGDVLLQNKTITGNLFLMDEIGEGDITLENVVVEGTLYIYGGGENTVTLRNVQAARVHLQKDQGTLGVLTTENTNLDNVLVKCDVLLTEENMTGTGFKNITLEPSQKNQYELVLNGVSLDALTLNAAANIHLNKDSTAQVVYANGALHVSGSGKMDTLQVRHNQVSYETAPRQLDVKSGYKEPVHGGYALGETQPTTPTEKDEEQGGSSGSSSSTVRLSTPTDLTIYYDTQQKALMVRFSEVQRSSGYQVTPYIKKDGLGSAGEPLALQGSTTTTAVILANPEEYLGQEIQVKVKALGDTSQKTRDSSEASTAYTAIALLEAPTGLSASLVETSGGLSYRLTWDPVTTRCKGYTVTAAYQGQENQVRSEGNTVDFSFDRGGDIHKEFTFTVIAHPKEDTTLLDSLPSASVTENLTVLPEPTQRSIALLEDGSLAARWTFPKDIKNYTHFTVIPCLDSLELEAISVPMPQLLPEDGTYTIPIFTAEQATEKYGSILSFKVRANAAKRHISSGYVAPASVTLKRDLPAPQELETFYSSTARRLGGVESPGGYYYKWKSVAGAAGYRVTPILIRDGEERVYPSVDLPANITEVRAWSKTGVKSTQEEMAVAFKAGDRLTFTVESISGTVGRYPMEAARCTTQKEGIITQLPTPVIEEFNVTRSSKEGIGEAYDALVTLKETKNLPEDSQFVVTGYDSQGKKLTQQLIPVFAEKQVVTQLTVLPPEDITQKLAWLHVSLSVPSVADLDSIAASTHPLCITLLEDAITLTSTQTEEAKPVLRRTITFPRKYAGNWTLTLAVADEVFYTAPVALVEPVEGETISLELPKPLPGKQEFPAQGPYVVCLTREDSSAKTTYKVQSGQLTGEAPATREVSSSSQSAPQ